MTLVALEGLQMVLTGRDTDSGMGMAYPMVDTNLRGLWKKLNRKYCTSLDGWASFLQTKQHTLQPIMSKNGHRDIIPRVIVLIENWKGQLKHLLSMMEADKGMKGWLTCPRECVLKLSMNLRRVKECPHGIDFPVFLIYRRKSRWGRIVAFFLPHITSIFFPYLINWWQDQGWNYKGYKQWWFLARNYNYIFNFCVGLPKGLMGPDVFFTPSDKIGADSDCCCILWW